MVDVLQYPDILTAIIIGPTTDDGDGNPIPGGGTTRTEKCRGETPNTQAKFITNIDGESIPVSFVIYMPYGVVPIAEGTQVEITRRGYLYCKGTVKRFYNGQLNTRIWL